jgi:hypothetical protein
LDRRLCGPQDRSGLCGKKKILTLPAIKLVKVKMLIRRAGTLALEQERIIGLGKKAQTDIYRT